VGAMRGTTAKRSHYLGNFYVEGSTKTLKATLDALASTVTTKKSVHQERSSPADATNSQGTEAFSEKQRVQGKESRMDETSTARA